MKIGIFDSGIGGLNICSKLIKIYPDFKYMYYADNLNMPYGNKSKAELSLLVRNAMDYFLINGADAVIIACNTVSCTFYREFENEYPFKIIYIAPDVEKANEFHNQIAILATENTKSSNFFKEKLTDYEFEYIMPNCGNLASLTEKAAPSFSDNYSVVAKILSGVNRSFAIVLGCTHYTFYRKYIEGLGYSCYDETAGVLRDIEAVVDCKNILKHDGGIDVSLFLTDKADKLRYLEILRKLNK